MGKVIKTKQSCYTHCTGFPYHFSHRLGFPLIHYAMSDPEFFRLIKHSLVGEDGIARSHSNVFREQLGIGVKETG